MLRETESGSDGLLSLVVEAMPAACWSVDRSLVLESMRGVGLSGLRSDRNDSAGRSLFEFFATDDRTHPSIAAHLRALDGHPGSVELTHSGRTFKIFVNPSRDAAGLVTGVRGFALDITAEHVVVESLRRSEEALALAQSAARLGSWTCELQSGWVMWSEEMYVLCGLAPYSHEPSIALLRRFVHPDDVLALDAAIEDARELEGSFVLDTRLLDATGNERWVQHRGRFVNDGGAARLIGTVLDITLRKTAEAKTEYHANYDELTGLPNRKLLTDRLHRAIVSAANTGAQVAVLYLDFDRFNTIHDTLGHEVGNQFLRNVAPRLAQSARHGDIVARAGSDEFIVVLPEVSSIGEAGRVAERIVAAFAKPVEIEGRQLYSSVSIGISVYPDDGENASELIRAADVALMRAKESGHGSFRFYAAATHARAVDRLELESALRGALDRDEFVVHYQPIVDRFERPVAIEALLRWERPGSGLVPPDQFIPICEEVGLILPLGRWVMRRACSQLADWVRQGHPAVRVALNISARQMLDVNFVSDLRETIVATGLAPALVELEITESVLMSDIAGIRRAIDAIKALGVRIALDDFGTGYSTLSYLKHFSVDALKIDRTFVRDLPSDRGDAAIVSAVVALGHAMGLSVVAEGVETAEQAALVRKLGCDELQGYYFAKPASMPNLQRILRTWTA